MLSFQWAAAWQGHGMDAAKAALLWKSRTTPEDMSLQDVQALIYSTPPANGVVAGRPLY